MAAEDLVIAELQLNRFHRLVGELMRGAIGPHAFQPWEVDLLLDFQTCQVDRRRRLDILRQYERVVERQMESGPGPPMKLSDFLERRAQRAAAKDHSGDHHAPAFDAEIA